MIIEIVGNGGSNRNFWKWKIEALGGNIQQKSSITERNKDCVWEINDT